MGRTLSDLIDSALTSRRMSVADLHREVNARIPVGYTAVLGWLDRGSRAPTKGRAQPGVVPSLRYGLAICRALDIDPLDLLTAAAPIPSDRSEPLL